MNYKFIWGLLLYSFMLCLQQANAQCPNSYTINNSTKPSCPNSTDGRLWLNQTTYYSSATYQWSNGSTNRTLNGVGVGHYSVTVTDPTGCTYTHAAYLGVSPTGVGVDIYSDSCNNTLSAYTRRWYGYSTTYQWSTGATSSSINYAAPGVYSVTITTPDGCVGTSSHTVTAVGSPLQASFVTTPASCNANDGSIDLTPSGGVPPYTYYWRRSSSWGNIATTQDLSNARTGDYVVQISDARGCFSDFPVSVGGPTLSVSGFSPSCGVNGSATVVGTNMPNATYLWSNGATTPTITNLTPGGYGVTVTSGTCILRDTVFISSSNPLQVYAVDSSQGGCHSTTLAAFAYGGAGAPYTYQWNTGQTTSEISVQSGVNLYIVTVTDHNGCMAVDTVDVSTTNGSVTVSASVLDATCGNSDGAIDLTVIGSYDRLVWSPGGAVTEDLTNIPAGRYVVSFYNANNCLMQMDTFLVGEFIETIYSAASCGLNNGSAAVTTYNMQNPTYSWSNGATTPSISNLAAGTYTVQVTNGTCVLTETITIIDAGTVSAAISPNSSCLPDYLTAVPTGGSPPYSYLWGTGETTPNYLSPVAGTAYSVVITDANGCSSTANFTVPNHPLPTLALDSVVDATCGNKNGSIALAVSGGTSPYNYQWSAGPGNVSNYIGVRPGTYSATVTDNNGCTAVVNNLIVGGQIPASVTGLVSDATFGNSDGAIDVTVHNSPNATFVWSNGATTEDLTNIPAGTYNLSVTDPSTGCVIVRCFRVYNQAVAANYSSIHGRVYDVTASGVCQRGLSLANRMVRLQPTGQIAFTDATGYYQFVVTTAGNYSVEYVNTSLTTSVLCPVGNSHPVTVVLGQSNGSHDFHLVQQPFNDLRILLRDYSNATPGFPYVTRVRYCNDGNTIRSGTIEYDYNPILGFDRIVNSGSTLTLHDIPNHHFYWSFNGLQPAECRWIDVIFDVTTTTPLGTSLVETATVLPTVGDVTPNNNVSSDATIVVGAYDPNDKQVGLYHTGDAWSGGTIYEDEEVLDYTIRFQNTGTAPANWVIIRDTLDQYLLPETIRDIDSKHDVEVTLEQGNILVFTFNNIYLPDSGADMTASMGFVQFTINRQAGLPVGTQIANRAAIYFDYNPPIITNEPVSVIDRYTSVVKVSEADWTVQTQPNPFQENLLVSYELEEASTVRLAVYNAVGQCVYVHDVLEQPSGEQQVWMDLPTLPSGYYFLQIETNQRRLTKPLVKQ